MEVALRLWYRASDLHACGDEPFPPLTQDVAHEDEELYQVRCLDRCTEAGEAAMDVSA